MFNKTGALFKIRHIKFINENREERVNKEIKKTNTMIIKENKGELSDVTLEMLIQKRNDIINVMKKCISHPQHTYDSIPWLKEETNDKIFISKEWLKEREGESQMLKEDLNALSFYLLKSEASEDTEIWVISFKKYISIHEKNLEMLLDIKRKRKLRKMLTS